MNKLIKKIGTHDGVFHCDEVLACFMLKRLPEFADAEIIRTRDDSVLSSCDIVVDVGAVYDPEKHRYDHHQSTFSHTMKSLDPSRPWNIRLSSAGLIYHHFGERVLRSFLDPPHEPAILKNLFSYIYENFIQEIDGIDNGVPMFEGEPKYNVNTDLSCRVGNLNPWWNSKSPSSPQELFYRAMDLVGKEFSDRINYFVNAFWPARELVEEAITNRLKVHESGEIIELSNFCPWKKHLAILENELNINGLIKFVIFDTHADWRVQAVPVEPNSYICRLFLHEKWRGLRNEELSKVSGIDGCIFVHQSGFIGGNKTRDGALAMALKTIQLNK